VINGSPRGENAGLLVCAISEIVHGHIQRDGPIWLSKECLVVPGDELHVVVGVKVVLQNCRLRQRLIIVVD